MVLVSVFNFKGGSGKSTTAVVFSKYLAVRGYKVLLVDCDPQGSASLVIGESNYIRECVEGEKGIPSLIHAFSISPESINRELVYKNIFKVQFDGLFGFSVLPNSIERRLVQVFDLPRDFLTFFLVKIIEAINGDFDIVIFDTPPYINPYILSVLGFVNAVIVPTELTYLGIKGTEIALSTLAMYKAVGTTKVARLAVLPTKYRNTKEVDSILGSLKEKVGPMLVEPPMPYSVIVERLYRGEILADKLLSSSGDDILGRISLALKNLEEFCIIPFLIAKTTTEGTSSDGKL
ncbi:MAG: ParA family protein [Thermosulfidibacteraceae bacterium]|jgi:chromosome partitioning protein